MVQAKPRPQTFGDYLVHSQDMEARYELTNEELIEMPPEFDENVVIAWAMDCALLELVGFRRVRTHQLALEMSG